MRRLLVAGLSLILGLLAFGFFYERDAEDRFASHAVVSGQLIDIGNRRIHLLCQGEASPIVLLEASGLGTSLQYSKVLLPLATNALTCAYDRAGMGFSDPSITDRTAQELVGDLWTTLVAAHLPGPYVVVASSFGGLPAELFARQRPQDVVGLVMLDALTDENVDQPIVGSLASKACMARWASEVGLLRFADPLNLQADPVTFGLTYQRSTWRTVCDGLEQLPVTSAELKSAPPLRSDLPLTVVVHGEPRGLIPFGTPEQEKAADPAWLGSQKAFAARSKRGKLVTAAKSGHLIAEDRPDIVIDEVRAMLQVLHKDWGDKQ